MFEDEVSDVTSFKKFIILWNNRFPIDRWWRQRHNVAFNSPVHRDSCLIDMYWEFVEEKLSEIPEKKFDYVPGAGDFLIERVFDRQSLIDSFATADFSKMDDK